MHIKPINYIGPDLLFSAGPDLLLQIGAGAILSKYNEIMSMVSQSSILEPPESPHIPTFPYTRARLNRYPRTRCGGILCILYLYKDSRTSLQASRAHSRRKEQTPASWPQTLEETRVFSRILDNTRENSRKLEKAREY